jgi:biopolymer transport protein ExbD
MPIRSGGFSRKSEASSDVPDSSMADIAFLLLIFFMVTTVFQKDRKVDIVWPEAEATQKIDEKLKNILNIWVQRDGVIFINDRPHGMGEISQVIAPLYAASDRALVISIRADREVQYQTIDLLQQQLVAAGVVRVVFATELEQRMTRERR